MGELAVDLPLLQFIAEVTVSKLVQGACDHFVLGAGQGKRVLGGAKLLIASAGWAVSVGLSIVGTLYLDVPGRRESVLTDGPRCLLESVGVTIHVAYLTRNSRRGEPTKAAPLARIGPCRPSRRDRRFHYVPPAPLAARLIKQSCPNQGTDPHTLTDPAFGSAGRP